MTIYLVSFGEKKKLKRTKLRGNKLESDPSLLCTKTCHTIWHIIFSSRLILKKILTANFDVFLCKQVTIKFSQLLLMRMDSIWSLNCQTNSRELLSKDVPSYATQSCSNVRRSYLKNEWREGQNKSHRFPGTASRRNAQNWLVRARTFSMTQSLKIRRLECGCGQQLCKSFQ